MPLVSPSNSNVGEGVFVGFWPMPQCHPEPLREGTGTFCRDRVVASSWAVVDQGGPGADYEKRLLQTANSAVVPCRHDSG